METALRTLEEGDSLQAIEFLNGQPDTLAACKAYADLVRHLYWQKKDLYRVVVMARAGMQHGLMAASAGDADTAYQLRSVAKGLAFDLGSFTWPGWDEPGLPIPEAYLAFGLDAARTNLRLAEELKKGDLPLSRAHWLVGAHLVAQVGLVECGSRDPGHPQEAQERFTAAVEFARKAGAETAALMNTGYQHLAAALTASDTSDAQKDFNSVLSQLSTTDEGKGYVQQLETAWRVFVGDRQ